MAVVENPIDLHTIAQEPLFRLIFENAAVGIAQIDHLGKFQMVNNKLTQITGYTKEELLQKTFQEITHPDDLEADLKQAEALFRNEINSYSMEKRYIRKDGTIVWIKLTGSAVFDEQNKFTTFIAVIEDISDKKNAEEALHKSEQYYKIASSSAKIGAYFRNLETGENYWSPEFLKIYGLNPEDPFHFRDGIPEAVHPEDRKSVLELAQLHYQNSLNSDFSSDHRIILPDGSIRWINIKGVTEFNILNIPVRTYGIVMDITERKEVEEALRESEEKYRALFKSIDEGFCICEMLIDEDGEPYDYRWLEVNPVWEVHTGLKAPVGRTALELVPNLEKNWIDIYGKVALTGEPIRFQQESKAMNRWFDVYAFRVNEPHLCQFGILFSDITNRIKAEEALRHKVEENEKLMNVVPAAIWMSNDPDCNYLTGNAMANKLLEAEKEESLAAKIISNRSFYSAGKKMSPVELPMQKAASENKPVLNQVLDILLPSGKKINLQGSAVPLNDEWGKVRGAIGAFIDITHRVESERAVKESEEKFRILANNMSQLAWMMDHTGYVFWYNQRWFDYTGTTLEEMQGWGWQKMHHPNHINRVITSKKNAIESGKVWEEQFPLRSKEGQYRWFLTRAVPVKDENGNIIRWLGTNTDVTHQRNIEKQLKSDSKLFEDLLYIAAHDLKGPVANMYGALDLMDSLPVDKKVMFLTRFRDLADQLNSTIHGVTDILSMRSSDKSAATMLNVEKLLDKVLLELSSQENQVTIQRKFEKPIVYYVELFLYSIIKNLVSNAFKYCREDVPLLVEITTQVKDEYTLLTVRDNGIGIDLESYGEKLFSPFQRFNPKKTKGTGIGLYIIKDIISKNGGYITVDSTPGEGTRFNCYLKEY